MTYDPKRSHTPKPGYMDVLEILRRLLEIAGHAERPGRTLVARKIRHHDRSPYLAWDEAGRRTKGAIPTAWTEFILGWIDATGAFEGPPHQAGPADSWEKAILDWANALTAAAPVPNPDLERYRCGILALVQAAEANPGPQPRKVDVAKTWLQYLFAGTHRTEIPAAEIFERARARGITQGTLLRAKRAAGYRSRERRENKKSSWLWIRPLSPKQNQACKP